MPAMLFKKQIHRRIFRRTLVACCLAMMAAAVAGTFFGYRHLESTLLRSAERESGLFAALMSVQDSGTDMPDRLSLSADLRDILFREGLAGSSFIQVRLTDRDRQVIFSGSRDDGAARQEQFGSFDATETKKAQSSLHLDDKRLFLQVSIPLRESHRGRITGYLEGIYRPSLPDIRAAIEQLAAIGALVAGATILCGLLLYPGMALLHRRLIVGTAAANEAAGFLLKALGIALSSQGGSISRHHHRLLIYAVALAKQQRLGTVRTRHLAQAVLIHDLARLIGPEQKQHPGAPGATIDTPAAREALKTLGRRLRKRRWLRGCDPIVSCQHERYDGNGWPAGLSGEKIPVEARMLAIVDRFDTVTLPGPGSDPINIDEALYRIERESGAAFDPVLVAEFAAIAPNLYTQMAGTGEQRLGQLVDRALRGLLPS